MTDEDRLAAKLKGYNCLLKFKDNEELFLKSRLISHSDEDERLWFEVVEDFINGNNNRNGEYFPIVGISVARDCIKYIMKI